MVSLESGQLLLKAKCGYDVSTAKMNEDDETRSIHHSLKLYAIYCQMRANSSGKKGIPFWIKSGAGGISFREDYHQFQNEGQYRQVSAVFILCTRPEVDFDEASIYFDLLHSTYSQKYFYSGSNSAQLEACQNVMNTSFKDAKESLKKLKGSIRKEKVVAALTSF